MGRRRTVDKHLPRRMYQHHGAYIFVPLRGKPIRLGVDLAEALAKYGQQIAGNWTGRTLGDAIDRYRAEVLPAKRSKDVRYAQGLQLDRLKKTFGHVMPDSVTVQHLYRYLDERRNKDGKAVPVLARHEVKLLGHVYAKAFRWGLASVNPVRRLERMPKSKRTRYVTDAEFEAVQKMATDRIRIAMELALLSGQRRGDILTLRYSQLTDEGIEWKQGKTGAEVGTAWSPALHAVIDRSKEMKPQVPREFVIRKRNGKAYSARGFSAIWQRLMGKAVKAGIARFTFHDIRAKYGSDKASLSEASEGLGHTNTDTTKRHYRRKRPLVPALR